MNLPAVLAFLRAARDPRLTLPHATVATFADLPIPLSRLLTRGPADAQRQPHDNPHKPPHEHPQPTPDIRAVVLDKDNCFASPHSPEIHPSAEPTFAKLRAVYGRDRILIVSNSAGLARADPGWRLAEELERNTGVSVLRHERDKPGCAAEVLGHFRLGGAGTGAGRPGGEKDLGDVYKEAEAAAMPKPPGGGDGAPVTSPAHIAVVGDRLGTDTALAHAMGAWSVWVRDGVPDARVPTVGERVSMRFERAVARWCWAWGFEAPRPRG